MIFERKARYIGYRDLGLFKPAGFVDLELFVDSYALTQSLQTLQLIHNCAFRRADSGLLQLIA